MNNEELKKKIVEIIQSVDFYDGLLYRYCIDIATADKLADALIAAGIGDVGEYKEKLKLHRVFVRKDGGDIKVLYGNNEVDEIVKERNEYKHRAEVAERALQIADELGELCGRKEDYVQQAEKELAEERK